MLHHIPAMKRSHQRRTLPFADSASFSLGASFAPHQKQHNAFAAQVGDCRLPSIVRDLAHGEASEFAQLESNHQGETQRSSLARMGVAG